MRVLLTLLQVATALAAVVGLYLLAGPAWTLLVGGLLGLVGAVVAEVLLARARRGGGRF